MSEFFKKTAQLALQHIDSLLEGWYGNNLLREGEGYRTGDVTGEGYRSVSVNGKTGAWFDHAGGAKGGDLISLNAARLSCSQHEAAIAILEELGEPLPEYHTQPSAQQPKGKVNVMMPVPDQHRPAADTLRRVTGAKAAIQYWEYRDAEGRILHYVVRWPSQDKDGNPVKEIRPVCFDCDKQEWRSVAPPEPRPLYGLDQLAARPEAPVIVVEGEKTADAAAKLFPDHVAVTWSGGSKTTEKADWTPLADRDVILWPDHDSPGLSAMSKAATRLKARSLRMVAVPDSLPAKWDVADSAPPDIDLAALLESAREVRQTPAPRASKQDVDEVDEALRELNGRHFVTQENGRTWIINYGRNEKKNRWELTYSSRADLSLKYANRQFQRGRQWVDLGTLWIQWEKRREYSRIVMDPHGNDPDEFNLWTGFTVEPKPGEWSYLEEHIYENICLKNQENFRWLMRQLACKIKNPALRPEVAIVLRGRQGTGKGKLVRTYGELFGGHFVPVAQPSQLIGKFNAHLRTALIVFADEAFWAGDKAGEGVLKNLITEPTLAIEPKGKDVIHVPNMIMCFMASNADWVVPAAQDERRYAVFDVSEDRAQDHEFFRRIDDQLRSGGTAGFLHALQNYDTEGHNHRQAPWTPALLEQQIRTLPAEYKWWLEKLKRGLLFDDQSHWTQAVPWERLLIDFQNAVKGTNMRERGMATSFGMFLRKMCKKVSPGCWPRRTERQVMEEATRADGTTRTDTKTVQYVEFPELSACRSSFQHQGPQFKVDFGEDEDQSSPF